MNKNAYYLLVMASDTYSRLDWCISAFSVVDNRPLLKDAKYNYQIVIDPSDPEALFCALKEGEEYKAVKIEQSSTKIPLYNAKDSIDIIEGDLRLSTGNINTTYGIILGNMFLLYYPYGSKFRFINNVISGSFDKAVSKLLVDYPPQGTPRANDKVYVDEYIKYGEACGAIAGLDKLFSTGGSINTLSMHPSVIKLRDELIKKHAHELDDIRVQASIEEQLVAADKASFKDDPDALDFLISKKSYNPTRKKQLGLIGGSSGFGSAGSGTASFIPLSLKDGWRIEDIPVHVNEARSGSFNRGKETATGGTEVKNATRMAMNFRILKDFCNTKRGLPATVFAKDFNKYIGLYLVTESGEPKLIDKELIESLEGKTIMTHSPMYCLQPGDSYCEYCIGKNWTLLEHGLSTAVTNIGDVLMYVMMKRMHSNAKESARYNWRAGIR